MKIFAVITLCAATAFAQPAPKAPIAYSADIVVTSKGETTHSHVASDGTRTSTRTADGKSGSFMDKEKKLNWVYGPSFGCLQLPLKPAGYTSSSREEVIGNEKLDGHPTKKVKVTSTYSDGKKTTTTVMTEWRATDLQDLVIRRKSESEDFESHLEHIVMGKPDAKSVVLPTPPCKYDEAADLTHNEPQQPGGFRTISFYDGSCKRLVPLPLTMAIPSDYEIRSGGPRGCLWGTTADLDRVLAGRSELDFESIAHGVFWCRVSGTTQYDPVNGFNGEAGPQSQWAAAYRSAGARNISVTSRTIGQIPTSRVTASMNGQHVYMLYLAVPGTDSPAVLINYHPAGKGGGGDDIAWQHFLDSIQAATKRGDPH